MIKHLKKEELEQGLEQIKLSPRDKGVLNMIVIRPDINERKVLTNAHIDLKHGVFGDNWINKPSSSWVNNQAHPEKQVTVMNTRCISLIAQDKERWPLAGDQLYVDIDLSDEHLPPGSQLAIGNAIIEVTPPPHTGCRKFVDRFGLDAMKFVNSTEGKKLNLRGVNAKVIQAGSIKTGDLVVKL